ELRVARDEREGEPAELVDADLEADARPRGGLLEEDGPRLPLEGARMLGLAAQALELARAVEELEELRRGEVLEGTEMGGHALFLGASARTRRRMWSPSSSSDSLTTSGGLSRITS